MRITSKKLLVACFFLLLSSLVFAAGPKVASNTYPDGEWGNSQYIFVEFDYSGASQFLYLIDQSPDTVPNIGDEGVKVTDDGSRIALGSRLDGIYWLHVRAKAGNTWSDTTHYELKVDSSGPSRPKNITVTSLDDGGVLVQWGASEDSLSGVAYYNLYRSTLRFVYDPLLGYNREFSVRDAVAKKIGAKLEGTSFTDTNFAIGEGYRFHYKVQPVDNAGNLGVVSSAASVLTASFCGIEFSINTKKTDGNLSIGIESNGFFKKGRLVVTAPGGTEYALVDGTERSDSLAVGYPLSGKSNGDYNIFFSAIDDDFVECTAESHFIFDEFSPQVRILAPSSSVVLTEMARFEIDGSDPGENASGIRKLELLLDDGAAKKVLGEATLESGRYVFDWNTLNYDNGRFTVIVLASDGAGNVAEDSGVYSLQNTFFARTNASSAISAAESERAASTEYLSSLELNGIAVGYARESIANADSNLAYSKGLFEKGYYYDMAQQYAKKAKDAYASFRSGISFSKYSEKVYVYNQDQLDVFLRASGIGSGLSEEAKQLIQETQPSRKLVLLQVKSGNETYYKATIEIALSAAGDENALLQVLEVVPKKFVDNGALLASAEDFRVLQNDPILVFGPFQISGSSGKKIVYSISEKLSKEQADLLLSSNVLNYYISPPIVLKGTTDTSVLAFSSLLDFSKLVSSLPPIEWNTTNLVIVGIAVLLVLGIVFLILIALVFAVYYFFIRKKGL
ncbi:MAG: fibronectin type III domain-containing protein [archaeon]